MSSRPSSSKYDDRDRDRDRGQDRDRDYPPRRDRSASPPRAPPTGPSRKPKELSMYKKSTTASSSGRDGYGDRGRYDDAARGMGGGQASSAGSFVSKRDPLDRMGARGSGAGAGGVGSDSNRERDLDAAPARYGGGGGGAGGSRYGQESGGLRGNERGERERSSYSDRDRDRDRPSGSTSGSAPIASSKTHPDRQPMNQAGNSAGGRPAPGAAAARPPPPVPAYSGSMMEIIANDRLGRKVRVKCLPTDTVGDLKKLIAAQTGTPASKIQLKKWYSIFKDHITLRDYEIHDGQSLEMY